MIEKTPLYINGELKGECLHVKLSQDQEGLDTRYAYHVEEFESLTELSDKQQEYFDWLKEEWGEGQRFLNQFMEIITKKTTFYVVARLSDHELAVVWQQFLSWATDQ